MNKPHKHAAIIKAWANGADIQVRPVTWPQWSDSVCPSWDESLEYRIKPEPVVVKYRRYLCRSLTITAINVRTHNKNNLTSVCDVEITPGFIRWIDHDWIEHTIEQ